MAVRQYIGARYVTKIYENTLDPSSAEWQSGVTYEPLTMVTYLNSSYLSKKEVPGSVGDPAANPSYWVVTGAYNGQILNLQNQIDAINSVIAKDCDLFSDVIALASELNEGDIVRTKGFSTVGVGAGLYMIHVASSNYSIACGSKYAELLYSDYIDIEALGCVHDGVTDLSNILNIAINLAYKNNPESNISSGYLKGGTTIAFGPFYYHFTDSLTIPANTGSISFEGCGQNTIIGYLGSSQALFKFSTVASHPINNVHFKDLTFESPYTVIDMEYPWYCTFDNLTFLMTSGTPIYLKNGVGCSFARCQFCGANYGTLIENCTTIYFYDSSFRVSSQGVCVTGSNDVNFINCIMEYNTTYGFYIGLSYDISLENCWIEGNDCICDGSDITIHSMVTVAGSGGQTSKITWNNTTANKRYIYADGIDHFDLNGNGLSLATTKTDKVGGLVRFNSGYTYELTRRKVTLHTKSVQLSLYANSAEGLISVNSVDGSFIGSYTWDGSSITITKIGGTLAIPDYTDGTTGYFTWTGISTDTFTEVTF